MLKTVALLGLLLAATDAAQAQCVSRGLGSACFEPRGNSALQPPNRRLLLMPQSDPRVGVEVPVAPAAPARRLRGPYPIVNGRVLREPNLLRPCVGALCGPQRRAFGTGCRSSRCSQD